MSKVHVFILDSEYPRRGIGCQIGGFKQASCQNQNPNSTKSCFMAYKHQGVSTYRSLPLCTFYMQKKHPDQSELKTCTLSHCYQDSH